MPEPINRRQIFVCLLQRYKQIGSTADNTFNRSSPMCYQPRNVRFSLRKRQHFLFIFLVVFLSCKTEASLMRPESVFSRVLEGTKTVYQFYAEVNVSVFDPEEFAGLEENVDLNLIPYEIPEKSYQQRICFVRDEFLSIETVDSNGNVLHIYIHEFGGEDFSMNLGEERQFTDEDVYFPAIVLYTKSLNLLQKGIHNLGITPLALQIADQNKQIFYRIGSDKSFLKVDPETFKVFEFSYSLQLRGRYFPVRISLSEWHPQKKAIPENTRFYINDRLFKEIRISKIRFSRIYTKRNSVMRKYRKMLPARFPFSLSLNHGK